MSPEDREEVKQIVYKALNDHREDVEERLNTMHLDMVSIRNEMTGMRQDFSQFTHQVTEQISSISDSVKRIADNMASLGGLPDTWQKLRGFWAVVTWFKDNWFLFAVLGGLIFVSLWLIGFRVKIG